MSVPTNKDSDTVDTVAGDGTCGLFEMGAEVDCRGKSCVDCGYHTREAPDPEQVAEVERVRQSLEDSAREIDGMCADLGVLDAVNARLDAIAQRRIEMCDKLEIKTIAGCPDRVDYYTREEIRAARREADEYRRDMGWDDD